MAAVEFGGVFSELSKLSCGFVLVEASMVSSGFEVNSWMRVDDGRFLLCIVVAECCC